MNPVRVLPWVIGATLASVVVAGLVAWWGPERASPRPDSDQRALAVLADWDVRRARAWESGTAADLRALYSAGSPVGRADLRHWRQWRARDVRVRGLQRQVLRAEVRHATDKQVTLEVQDRMVGALAVTGDGTRPLPSGPTRRRHLEFARTPQGWVLSGARVLSDAPSHSPPRP